jgi:hypothetical protein
MGGVGNKIVIASVSVYLGIFLSGFFKAITRDLVLPLLSPLASVESGVATLVVQIGGIKFNIGDVIVQVINLVIAVGVIYLTLPYLKEYVAIAGQR